MMQQEVYKVMREDFMLIGNGYGCHYTEAQKWLAFDLIQRVLLAFLEEHYKDGADSTVFMSGDVRLGYMNGLKEGEGNESSGSVGDIIDSDYISV